MLSPSSHRRLALLAAAGTALSASSSLAQFTWAVPGTSGAWNLNGNWLPAGFPNSATATANLPGAAAYTVTVTGTVNVSNVNVGPGATLLVNPSVAMYCNNAAFINNDGIVMLNSSAAGTATIAGQGSDVALNGSGALVLNGPVGNPNAAQLSWWNGNERIVNSASHTVRGTGRILAFFTNNGTVNANVPTSSINLTDQTKLNNSLMLATNGGILNVLTRIDQPAAGIVRAENGSVVSVASGSVYGGSLGSSGTGVVRFSGSNSLGSAPSLFGAQAIAPGAAVYVENSNITNNSTLTINETAGATSQLSIRSGDSVWSGTGTIRLNAGADLTTAQLIWWNGNERFTNSAGHSVRGTGRIFTFVTNNGLIAADVAGKALWLTDNVKTNNNIIEAAGGGILRTACSVVQSPTAIIRCDAASQLSFEGASITGGIVNIAAGAVPAQMITGVRLLSTPTFNGNTVIPANNSVYLEASGLVNNGNLVVNPTGGNQGTVLSLRGGNGTLSGTGTIRLNANPISLDTAQLMWWNGNEIYTQAASHSILGTGRMLASFINDGLVSADVNGATMSLTNNAKTNNNVFEAVNGGRLLVNSDIIQGAAGTILADSASLVDLQGTTITGGLLESGGSGYVAVSAGTRFNTLRSTADVRVSGGSNFLNGGSTITNDGVMTVNNGVNVGGTSLHAINGNVTLSGSGELRLASGPDAQDSAVLNYWTGGEVVTNDTNHTISGSGRIICTLVNNGLVHADVAGRPLNFTTTTKTNNSVIRATGTTLNVNCTLNQGAAGEMQAETGSVIAFGSSAVLNGGRLLSQGDGVYRSSGNAYLQSFTNNSRVEIVNGSTFTSGGSTITNNGMMVVGTASAGLSGNWHMIGGSVDFSGTGSVILDANPANLDTAILNYWTGGERIINASGHTIGGTGRIICAVTNNGNITPGDSGNNIGRIHKTTTPMTWNAGGRFNVQLASATDYDRVTGDAVHNLDGSLQIGLINGYTGGVGTVHEILRGSSINGTFDIIDVPDHPTLGLKYGVQYTSNAVLVRVTCDSDFNSDGVVDFFDYLDFVDVFSSGVPDSDYNADGVVDFFDYLDFVDAFSLGCA